jgi:hypothetical protein
MLTDEPEVLTWMIALAPQPTREPVGRHWWRELVTEAWRCADHAWWLEREAVAVGYATEMAEFALQHPRPKLSDFMVHLSSGRWAPEGVLT